VLWGRHLAWFEANVSPESAGVMPLTRAWALGQPPSSRTKRLMRNLTRRMKRRVFLPGDSLADGVKRMATVVLGWGTVIGLLAWGAYRQGFLHGVGDGVTFCAVLFSLAFIAAPGFMGPAGRRGRNHY